MIENRTKSGPKPELLYSSSATKFGASLEMDVSASNLRPGSKQETPSFGSATMF